MKRYCFGLLFLLLLVSGCASSDRMFRMSGGVFDEYSAPVKSRMRSEKYQKISRNFASSSRSNQAAVAGLDDTLINIWPFFFRSNDYWSALWPLIDSDPYGFAFRPFYNHEGDDYSVLFPLSAWNNASGNGWVTLFAWNEGGFGFIPLTWQWKDSPYSGGAYYTPLFYTAYDHSPLHYTVNAEGKAEDNWFRQDLEVFAFLVYYGRNETVDQGNWSWLYSNWFDSAALRSEWNYHFEGKKPFPETAEALEKFRASVFATLPHTKSKSYGFLPLWYGSFGDDGNYSNRFMLLAGNYKSGKDFSFDVMGSVLGKYSEEWYGTEAWRRYCRDETTFLSLALMSYFSREYRFADTRERKILRELWDMVHFHWDFDAQRPRIEDKLKELEPGLVLPETVNDSYACRLFINDLGKKYEYPVYPVYTGRILPLVWYHIDRENYSCTLPPLLTWWEQQDEHFSFRSWPLLTFISRSPSEDSTVIFSPLAYYGKEYRRKREDHQVFSRNEQRVSEYHCVELHDQYAALGLFYRGRFGFNIAREEVDPKSVEILRQALLSLPRTGKHLVQRLADIEKETEINDRWQTKTEIERLKKLIRYEELKLMRQEWEKDQLEYRAGINKALETAGKLGFELSAEIFGSEEKAAAAARELVAKYTELRYYEDIGNGLFFRKEANSNGDYNWHFCHILAGGEKRGERESTHVLHLLYRYRKEGQRSETLFFPFVSMVEDGDDSKFSFLWRVFSLSKIDGKRGGHILFIPFGSEW